MKCKNCGEAEVLYCVTCDDNLELGDEILCMNIGDDTYHFHIECFQPKSSEVVE